MAAPLRHALSTNRQNEILLDQLLVGNCSTKKKLKPPKMVDFPKKYSFREYAINKYAFQ